VTPGAVIANRYALVRTIGSGGMGEVFQARRLADGLMVAIKILREELVKDRESVARFHREARAASSLRSENAARILDFGELPNRQPYLVMEFLDGQDLMTEIDTRGSMPLAEAAHYVAQACNAMIEAHGLGIVHRDLKPPNLFLANERGGRKVKVLDFGISKITSAYDDTITSTQMSFGSPLYMSPEQIRSTKGVDARSDVWSLGVILYECVLGEPPFVAETPGALAVVISIEPHIPPSQKRAGLPPSFDDVIAGALQKDPKKRYQSVQEFLRAIEEFLPREGFAADTIAQRQPSMANIVAPITGEQVGFVTTAPATTPLGAAAQQPGGTLLMPPRITLGPATTDPPVHPGPRQDRIGLIVAALMIPLGAVAFGFAIWLYSQRDPETVRPSEPGRAEDVVAAASERVEAIATETASATATAPIAIESAGVVSSGPEKTSKKSAQPSSSGRASKTAKPKPTQFVPATP
jgi:eukaryotic-like serine/threonine-protein kinase